MAQLDAQNSPLNSIHPAVPPNHGVVVLTNLTMIAKNSNLRIQLGIGTNHRSAFTKGAKVLARVKAETSCLGKRSDLPPLILGSMSLAGVLNNRQTVFPCHGKNGIHVCRLSKKVNWYDGLGLGRNSLLQRQRIQG